jgi:hypothetical protein
LTRLLSGLLIYGVCLLAALSLYVASGNPASAQQRGPNCLPVHGLSFERVGHDQLLAVRDGRNIAFISTCGALPDRLGAFRFFSPNLCVSGAEDRFHIDGRLYSVCRIETFANAQ